MPFDLPPVTRALLIANVGVYLLQMLLGKVLILWFALWPWSEYFHFWQIVSYGFLHGSLMHLAFNMLALYMFGGQVERALGARPYLLYYIVCVVGAAVTQLLVIAFFTGGFYPTLGASGGVFGAMFAFAYLWPQAKIIGFPFLIPIPAWLAVILYGGLELFYGVTGTQQGVAHFAHLGGLAGGWLMIQYWRGKLPWKPQRRLR